MGNHTAGKAMGVAAAAFIAARNGADRSALEFLDSICMPWKGCDAEFEAEDPKCPGHIHPDYVFYTDPSGPLGRLMAEAFGDESRDYAEELEQDLDNDAVDSRWYLEVEKPFRARYDFC